MENNDFQQTIAQVASELRAPGGDKFSSQEAVRNWPQDFIIKSNQTLKGWHKRSIEEILVLDSFLEAEKKKPIGPQASEWANYSLNIWRRINDAIIWILCGMQRHIVKRLCFYRPRTSLFENNPNSILPLIERINSDPLSIALWNDATTTVDIGDITMLNAGKLTFMEIKEGKINEAIFEILMKEEQSAYKIALDEFIKTHGSKKYKQLERVQRQAIKTRQAMNLLKVDKGIDPVTGKEIEIFDLGNKNEYWNIEFNSLLHDALEKRNEICSEINGCLWIYANANSKINSVEARHRFIELLQEREPRLTTKIKKNDLGRPVALYEGLYHPVSVPIFLRPIDPTLVGEILYGKLFRKVFLYFDWTGFASTIAECGGTLAWADKKEAAKNLSQPWDLRPFMVFGNLPKMEFGPVTMYPTGAGIDQVFFDGLTPKAFAQRQSESARLLIENNKKRI